MTVNEVASNGIAKYEYNINNGAWQTYNSTNKIIVSTEGTIYVKARAVNNVGVNGAESIGYVVNIDKTNPIVSFATNGGNSSSNASTVVTISDAFSGINSGTLQYVWDTQYSTAPSSGWVTFSNGDTLTKSGIGSYYLWIKANDNAGNVLTTKSNEFLINQADTSNANAPVLSNGMTAKKWNGSSWETVTDPTNDTSWYNYSLKKWANAQTADGSMWVWIPRYEYKIPTPHSSTAQTIQVNFLTGTSTTITSGYTLQPAFTFGSTELTGIWVAKFEASGTASSINIKPGIASINNISINSAFIACRSMETNDRYGWGTSGSEIDTHLMKNIEWGAVAYLTSSNYGKTGEVWINPNSYYITGQAGSSASSSSKTTTYPYDNETYGVNASTTGNIYGVYDMSGGVSEFVAAYVNNGNSSLTSYGGSVVSAEEKYKDIYISSGDTQSDNYSAISNKIGNAIYETSISYSGNYSWYGDNSRMAYSSNPFFVYGGSNYSASSAGLFSFLYASGSPVGDFGFRPVIAVSGTL